MHIFSPSAQYAVENVSIEDFVQGDFRIVSNVLVEKFNSTNRYVCDVVPNNFTYFYIDKTDSGCEFLNFLNVTNGAWIRVNYRIKLPGPEIIQL